MQLIFSQVGYDSDSHKFAYVSGNLDKGSFSLINAITKNVVLTGQVSFWGEKWKENWHIIDFSNVNTAGEYTLQVFLKEELVLESKTCIHIRKDLLWNRCWYDCTLSHLDVREANSYPEGGWRDCGSELQEVSSHVIMLEGICDLLDDPRIPSCEREHILHHILRGADYIVTCQQESGGFVHEIHHNPAISFGNCANAVNVLVRVSGLIKDQFPEKSGLYLMTAQKGYEYVENHDFFAELEENISLTITHDAPEDMTTPPPAFRTRDLLSLLAARIGLYQAGDSSLKEKILSLAREIMERQIPKEKAQHGLYGHFYTYPGYDFSEKANYHCGAWFLPYKNYNQGAHKPYWLLPFFDLMEMFPEHEDASLWKKTVEDFAYGFFKPSCFDNPFGILPAGVYKEHGILYFSGWYHGHPKIYGYAAILAKKFYETFGDAEFLKIKTANVQWICGLNLKGISFIVGIGDQYADDWNRLRGTIVNGFDASKQFSIAPVSAETDLPTFFDDEGGIHHCASFISALCK